MKLAIVLILLVIVTIIFHIASPWYFTPIASNWDSIDLTIDITIWITGFVFVAVNLFLAYAVLKYRHKKGLKAHYEPENKKLEVGLSAITTVGVIAMLAPGLFVWGKFINVPEQAHEVEALGQQWNWQFRLPGKDGKLGKSSPKFVNLKNPMGLDPRDPAAQDDYLVNHNELHLPIDQPVKVLLRSKDVLHNFAVPQFRVKMDLVPGMETYVWFTPTKEGTFEILCEELCGLAHHTMRGRVVVQSDAEYQAWQQGLPTFAATQAIPDGDPIKGESLYAICATCHGANGEGLVAMNGPKLNGQSSWYMQQQLEYYKKGIRGTEDALGQQMAAMAATLTDDQAVRDVIAYIDSLPETGVSPTIDGDSDNGSHYYTTCASCHGEDAEGNVGLKAPKLAGQHDWYLKRQLQAFKSGDRGQHPDDLYGFQMMLMSRILQDDQAIDDLVSYLNYLPEGE